MTCRYMVHTFVQIELEFYTIGADYVLCGDTYQEDHPMVTSISNSLKRTYPQISKLVIPEIGMHAAICMVCHSLLTMGFK